MWISHVKRQGLTRLRKGLTRSRTYDLTGGLRKGEIWKRSTSSIRIPPLMLCHVVGDSILGRGSVMITVDKKKFADKYLSLLIVLERCEWNTINKMKQY
jgi:hypothetical protein